ncbi:hypothetical protein ACS0TY_018053 [Phlomoides rotata]
MAEEARGKRDERDEEDVVIIEELGAESEQKVPLCLIGKVLTEKNFNAFGFLEAMKRAMSPTKGFTAKEIGPNLFSFQFKSHRDLLEVKKREPWHFEKHLVLLKEITEEEQPSTIALHTIGIWVRLYDLLLAARSEKYIRSIASKCGEVLDIDINSAQGFGRSIRVRVNLDVTKPLKTGIPLKFERLLSFCFLCGKMGHMKWECALVDDGSDILDIPDDKLPFGNWIKASPAKKASMSSDNVKEKCGTSPLRRRLFEKIKAELEGELHDTEIAGTHKVSDGRSNPPTEISEISEELGKISVGEKAQETGGGRMIERNRTGVGLDVWEKGEPSNKTHTSPHKYDIKEADHLETRKLTKTTRNPNRIEDTPYRQLPQLARKRKADSGEPMMLIEKKTKVTLLDTPIEPLNLSAEAGDQPRQDQCSP